MRPRSFLPFVLLALQGCGGSAAAPIVDIEEDEPEAPLLTGRVIASDAFEVIPVAGIDFSNPDFLIVREFDRVVPIAIGATTGKLLVFSVRDIGRPDAECEAAVFGSECASLVVLERAGTEPGTRPARLTVELESRRVTLFPTAEMTLEEVPPPG